MAAPDFFENFLLHNGLKALRPQENPLIVPFSRQRRHRQADTLHEGPNPHVGPWWAYLKPAGGGGLRPRLCQSPHYAGKIRAMPGKDARHANFFGALFLVFLAVFD